MNFDLPPLDGTATPVFTTAVDCKRWLGEQTLTNPAFVQRQLCEQIELLNRQAIALRERFGILEALQPQVAFVQEEGSKRYAAKPLPYLAPEAEAFAATMAMWQAVTVGYLRCLEDASASGASEQSLSTLVERALTTLHGEQLDRVRGFAQPDAQLWLRVHQLMAFAEERGVATTPTTDKAHYGEQAVTPLSVYAETMLLHAASAHEFSARPLSWVVRWARRWSGKLVLRSEPPADLQAVPINVDLGSSLPPSPFPIRGASRARFLDTADLANSIKMRITALGEGRSPAELQLGDDCTQPACEQMLQRLYQRWCKGAMQRPTDRHAATGAVEIAAGFEAIWFNISGNPFKQPRSADVNMLRREREEMATFGHVSGRIDTQTIDLGKLRAEPGWQILNEGPGGLRLLRATMTEDSRRIGVGQLVAVRKPGVQNFTLGSVRWLMVDAEGGGVHAGVHLLPGEITPVAIRNTGINTAKDLWRPAFVLVADQSKQQLVVVAGTFRTERMLNAEGGSVKQYKLAQLIERGDDFERVEVG